MGSLPPPRVKLELNAEAFLCVLERRTPGARLHECSHGTVRGLVSANEVLKNGSITIGVRLHLLR
jgi:hypothetical protein